ncbi:MAG: ABC transporter permease [Acidobacteria bacterium]|nr:ABC transporter permease [Acidobacteriota bacterium]
MHPSDSGPQPGLSGVRKIHPKRQAWASLWEASRISLDSIWAHKLRSFLTLLGIIIGVASVVSVGAAIEGLRSYVNDSLEGALGSNTIIVARFVGINLSYEDYMEMLRKHKPIRLEDMQAVQELCGDCEAITPSMSRNDDAKRGSRIFEQASIIGVNEDLLKIEKVDLEAGRFIAASDVMRALPIAVIGTDIRDELFGSVDAIGKTIRIGGDTFTVVGIEAKKGSNLIGSSTDNSIYIPYTAYMKKYGTRQEIAFRVKSPSQGTFFYTRDEVRQILRARHKLRPNQDDDFSLLALTDIQQEIDRAIAVITVIIIPVIAISMIIAAIVVMNIMLVIVTERTAEIGMRKALGARRNDILLQFLVESAILAMAGGVLGVLIAYLVSFVVVASTPVPMFITLSYIVFAVLSSGGIGVISGLYPAFKASKLDPIVALMRE